MQYETYPISQSQKKSTKTSFSKIVEKWLSLDAWPPLWRKKIAKIIYFHELGHSEWSLEPFSRKTTTTTTTTTTTGHLGDDEGIKSVIFGPGWSQREPKGPNINLGANKQFTFRTHHNDARNMELRLRLGTLGPGMIKEVPPHKLCLHFPTFPDTFHDISHQSVGTSVHPSIFWPQILFLFLSPVLKNLFSSQIFRARNVH